MSDAASTPRLRLVRTEDRPGGARLREMPGQVDRRSRAGRPTGHRRPEKARPQLMGATDPRWVLAMRVGEAMEPGGVLRPEKRETLTRIGKMLGLTAFDVSLVIAIVQDQVRRGHPTLQAPGAGADQLAMIQLNSANRKPAWQQWLPAGCVVAAVIVAEVILLWAWLA